MIKIKQKYYSKHELLLFRPHAIFRTPPISLQNVLIWHILWLSVLEWQNIGMNIALNVLESATLM